MAVRFNFVALVVAIVAVVPSVIFLPFYPQFEPEAFSLDEPRQDVGALAKNNALDGARTIGADVLIGPECVEFFDGYFYTGTRDGKIFRIKNDKIETFLDWKCDYLEGRFNNCSRPLGLRIDARTGDLYVADSVRGLYKVNVRTGAIETLFDASQPIDGKYSRLTDDLILMENGDVYFTDADTKFGFDELFLSLIEHAGSGRLLHYDSRTKKTTVVLDRLYFPNGIQLSSDKEYFIFCETYKLRIKRYYLKGPKKGTTDMFVDNLPGYPDNIRSSARGTYWVAMPVARLPDTVTFLDNLSSYPQLRSYLVRLPYLFLLPIGLLDSVGITENALSKAQMKVLNVIEMLAPNYCLVVELDTSGKIIRSLHSALGIVTGVSTAFEHEEILYLGSPWVKGLRILPLPVSKAI